MLNNDKSHSKFKLQLENLNLSIVEYFNKNVPFYITDPQGERKQIKVIYNPGETWVQVEEVEKKQAKGDFILQKPLITLKSMGIEPIKEWNRLPKHRIILDKQIYKNPNTKSSDYIRSENAIPVFEYTMMKYPTHYRRQYRLSIWTDFIIDQDNILETLMASLMASNTIMIKNDEFNTVGLMTGITDDSNFSNRTESIREIKNFIDFEFEGYLVHPDSIYKTRSFSHVRITEEIIKNS